MMGWNNVRIMEFLDLYESEPSIWNPAHANYKDRNEVYAAWKRIQQNLSFKCSIEELKRKKDSVMATFRACNHRIRDSAKVSTSSETSYRPKWFAYDKLYSFLKNVSQSVLMNVEAARNEHQLVDSDNLTEYEGDETSRLPEVENEETEYDTNLEFHPTKKFRSETFTLLKKSKETSSLPLHSQPSTESSDECEAFGKLLAIKLRKFDEYTRDVMMNKIDNIVFECKMQQYNQRHSNRKRVIHDETQQQQSMDEQIFIKSSPPYFSESHSPQPFLEDDDASNVEPSIPNGDACNFQDK